MNNYQATGRIVRNPELRSLADGTAVCKLRIAVKGMARGEVGFINVTSFGKSASAAAQMLTTGWLVAVSGRLEYHDWEAEDGAKRREWEIVGHVEFLAAPRSRELQIPEPEVKEEQADPA
jgi:single stranded DNA-binding protein